MVRRQRFLSYPVSAEPGYQRLSYLGICNHFDRSQDSSPPADYWEEKKKKTFFAKQMKDVNEIKVRIFK